MKLLLIRHGESEDDLINAYGGWADFQLTDKGKDQIMNTAKEIGKLKINFEKILSSPLVRAVESAEIISNELSIPMEIFEYVKERNTYGLLSGMKKEDALEKYPWLVEAYKEGSYVVGSERIEDINERAHKSFELIKDMGYENLAILTHGNFLKAFIPHVVEKKVMKKEDGGFILIEVNKKENSIIAKNGIEVK